MEPVISFKNVSKSYPLYHQYLVGIKNFIFGIPKGSLKKFKKNRYLALNDISFNVGKGESFGIIGRNGAGKSTILGLIAGVLKPSAGSITVCGKISPLLELGGGFHSELTGRENIELNGVLLGMLRKDVARNIDRVIEFSELGEFIDQPIRTYSSGMLTRLGFSVIAHLEPEILLIDEILAVGDANFQEKCKGKMKEFRERGVTIVLVTHSMADVEKLCDRAMWIEDCRSRIIGEPAEVINSYVKAVTS